MLPAGHMYRSLTLPTYARILRAILLVCTCTTSGFVFPSVPIIATGRTGFCSPYPGFLLSSNSVKTSSRVSFSSSLLAEAKPYSTMADGELPNAALCTCEGLLVCVRIMVKPAHSGHVFCYTHIICILVESYSSSISIAQQR